MEKNEDIINSDSFLELKKIEFEKYKFKMNFIKWIVTSVVIVIIGMIIDWNFRDRDAGMKEMESYDKYVTELVILNPEVGPRRLLAQYFACVTPSEQLRKKWESYYVILDKEYDSLMGLYNTVSAFELKVNLKDTFSILEEFNLKTSYNKHTLEKQLFTKIRTPTNMSANALEELAFDYILVRNKDDAIAMLNKCDSIYPTFHNVYEIRKLLEKEDDWNEIYKVILDKHTWGMSNIYINKFKEILDDN